MQQDPSLVPQSTAETQAQTLEQQLGLPDQFVVRRGDETDADIADTGWKADGFQDVADPRDPTGETVIRIVRISKQVTEPNGDTTELKKTRPLETLLSWQQASPETENSVEAEHGLEVIGAPAVHAEVVVDTTDTASEVVATAELVEQEPTLIDDTLQQQTIENEPAVDVGANASEDEEANDQAVEASADLQQLKEAQDMLVALADKFAPVEQLVRQLATKAEQEISQFANKQGSLLKNVANTVGTARIMASSIMEMTQFVSDLEDNIYGEVGQQERQAVLQLIESLQTLTQGMSLVESATTDAQRRGTAMQNELGDSLHDAIRAVESGLEAFIQDPIAVREKVMLADQERTDKRNSDTDYSIDQQLADDRIIGDVFVGAGDVVNSTDTITDEANTVRNTIRRSLDAGNSNLTSELLADSGLGGNVIESITKNLRVLVSRLDVIAYMRGSRGNLQAELKPLINGMLAPVIDSIMFLRAPNVQSSEQPRRLGKVTASISQMQQAVSAAQSYMDSLRK